MKRAKITFILGEGQDGNLNIIPGRVWKLSTIWKYCFFFYFTTYESKTKEFFFPPMCQMLSSNACIGEALALFLKTTRLKRYLFHIYLQKSHFLIYANFSTYLKNFHRERFRVILICYATMPLNTELWSVVSFLSTGGRDAYEYSLFYL